MHQALIPYGFNRDFTDVVNQSLMQHAECRCRIGKMMLTLTREMSVTYVSVLSNRTSSLTKPMLQPTKMNLEKRDGSSSAQVQQVKPGKPVKPEPKNKACTTVKSVTVDDCIAKFLSVLFLHEKKRTALDADQSQVTKSAKDFGGWLVEFAPTLGNLQTSAYTTGPVANSDIPLIRNHVQTER